MKVSEIYEAEGSNTGTIVLYKEGLFWRAYERSAFLFVHHIKAYQISKKLYKGINKELVYLGFPHTALEKCLQAPPVSDIQRKDNLIIIGGFTLPEEAFIVWKNGIKIHQTNVTKAAPAGIEDLSELIQKIKAFPIAHKTPMECQQFLIEIQNQLYGTSL